MLNIKLTIKTGDTEQKVTAGPATQVAFEREHGVGVGPLVAQHPPGHRDQPARQRW